MFFRTNGGESSSWQCCWTSCARERSRLRVCRASWWVTSFKLISFLSFALHVLQPGAHKPHVTFKPSLGDLQVVSVIMFFLLIFNCWGNLMLYVIVAQYQKVVGIWYTRYNTWHKEQYVVCLLEQQGSFSAAVECKWNCFVSMKWFSRVSSSICSASCCLPWPTN